MSHYLVPACGIGVALTAVDGTLEYPLFITDSLLIATRPPNFPATYVWTSVAAWWPNLERKALW